MRYAIAPALALVLIVSLVVCPTAVQADQAQYFYDELGRLVGAQDSQGNIAVYPYDEAGNLLSIQRFTTGTTGIGVFLMTPSSALVGTTVTIQGFGFSATPADNQVAFHGTLAAVVSASSSALVVTVPTGATSGPVTVTNTNGTATSPQAFTVLVPPIVVGVDPIQVPQGATSRAAISGFNLSNATAVTFAQSGLTATILTGGTAQSLPISLSVAASVPVGSYTFSVTTPVGTTQSGTITVTVTLAVPSFGLGEASVFKPHTGQPSGPSFGQGEASVFKPHTGQPSGPSVGQGEASVFKPFPAQTPPSGPSFAVTPPTSVQMP